MSDVLFDVQDHVARVTINRPHVLNAINPASEAALQSVWQEIEKSSDIWVVVLTGAGERAFCVGADMTANEIQKSGLEYWAEDRSGGFGGLALRQTLDVPVIAAVNGYALGGGLEIVLGCDIVVAAEHARFGLPEPRVGRIPLDGGVVQLVRQIAYRHALAMLLTGRQFSAVEALQMGLINEVAPAGELDSAVQRWADDIVACAPLSLKAIKQILKLTAGLTPQQAARTRLPALTLALESADAEEGVRAFQEKRKPRWQAR